MLLGEVYGWETEQVKGRDKRFKRHIYICKPDGDLHCFLFINKSDWHKDHKLEQAKYKTFLDYDSYVAGNSVGRYHDTYLKKVSPPLMGSVDKVDLKAIRDAIIAADSMPRQDQNIICKALAAIL